MAELDTLKETFHTKIAGLTFRPEVHSLLRTLKPGTNLIPQREPTNEHDFNAIQVLVSFYGTLVQLGYIPREVAADIAPLLDEDDATLALEVSEITGGTEGKENLGCNIIVTLCHNKERLQKYNPFMEEETP